jgi:RNA polymerase sigma factor (TIGR02999 family)
VTGLLARLADGEAAAHEQLLAVVYDELRRVAAAYLARERVDHTLQPTALVHEAYIKLVDGAALRFDGRAQFFALAARAMRQILVDHARTKGRLKRGGGGVRLTLDDNQPTPTELSIPDLLAIDEALEKLAQLDERKARLVELRFFAGLTSDEAAEALGIARSTAAEDWRFTKAWLRRELEGEAP